MSRSSSRDRLRVALDSNGPGIASTYWAAPDAYPSAAAAASLCPRFIDDCCANCFLPLGTGEPGLFCTSLCKATAKDVRYIRRKIHDPEQMADPDVHDAIRTKLAHLLAGGYDDKARRISPLTREFVWSRDRGLCVECGQPGAEIDHISGDSSDPGNLQLLCTTCHHRKTDLQLHPATDAQRLWLRQLFEERITPPLPTRLADDEASWSTVWRGLTVARAERRSVAGHR